MPRALVIGGGVAGPAVAQLLARDGWDTHVYEAHARARPVRGPVPQRRDERPRRPRARSVCATGCSPTATAPGGW